MEPGEAEPPAPKVLPPSIRSRMPPRELCFASSYVPFLCVFVVFAGTMLTQDSTLFCREEANETRANHGGDCCCLNRPRLIERGNRRSAKGSGARRSRSVLRHLPQRTASHGWAGSGQAGCDAPQLECG